MSSNVLSAPEIAAGVFTDTSSNDVAVSVRDLSKSYRIARNAEKHSTLSEAMMSRLKNPLARVERDTFWALNDVSFDIQKGDVVGIIGRNGAGKSTLLKILSRITEPTKGRIDLYGRVGSLLEVGTGFHPELTGRENVYLNGAILGMSKGEIARQFDEIVAFSGTEKFLDTPVKRYSSGMYVRLAFAVAAHLNPEILIIDEVLAVGDADFQKKCIGKMQDVAKSGRTVLFVSHNMPTVQKLCTDIIMLQSGTVAGRGEPIEMITRYQASGESDQLTLGVPLSLRNTRRLAGDGQARFSSILPFAPGEPVSTVQPFRQGDLGFRLQFEGDVSAIRAVSVYISDESDRKLINTNTLEKIDALRLQPGQAVDIIFRDVRLRPGLYKVGLWIGGGEERHIDIINDELALEVLPLVGRSWVSKHDGVIECDFDYDIVPA